MSNSVAEWEDFGWPGCKGSRVQRGLTKDEGRTDQLCISKHMYKRLPVGEGLGLQSAKVLKVLIVLN